MEWSSTNVKYGGYIRSDSNAWAVASRDVNANTPGASIARTWRARESMARASSPCEAVSAHAAAARRLIMGLQSCPPVPHGLAAPCANGGTGVANGRRHVTGGTRESSVARALFGPLAHTMPPGLHRVPG